MSEHFCLKWNNHQTTLVSVFDKLLECESLVDCTLAADGRYMKAHKVVLSACSSYLEEILRNHEDKHPILIFNDISYSELKAMLEYMYRGEVNVSQEQLNTFLKAAEALKIKGLTDQGGGGSSDGGGQDNLKRKMGAAQSRKTQSPVLGMTPVERPTSPKRRKPARRQSRDENFPGDSNSCDTAPTPPPSQPQQVNSIAARIEEKVAKIKKESGSTPSGAEPPGGAAALSALGMLQPKTEFLEESGNVEDLTLEEEEEYGPNPGTSQGSFSSQDFNNWQLGDPTSDEVFMASQHELNNSAGNSQGKHSESTLT
uniref:BTB domain-containing protein n=1 Tax=Rhodnius prolixus TaxID=13249 RepID=T1I9J5_RHOPR